MDTGKGLTLLVDALNGVNVLVDAGEDLLLLVDISRCWESLNLNGGCRKVFKRMYSISSFTV